jgi:hypothetical protein
MPVQVGQPRHGGEVGGDETDHVRVVCYFRGGLQRESFDPYFVWSETEIDSSWLSAIKFLGSAEGCTGWVPSAGRLLPMLPKTIH